MALVLESRFTKDQILELYLNDIVLGQRGPFAIHGVPEAARIFFGKDVRNVTLAEAATIAGIIQSPSRFSPFRNPERARERRNVVLGGMAEAGVITAADAKAAQGEPLIVASRAFENEAPYFVDYVSSLVDEKYGGLLKRDAAVDVYTTLDLHLQRLAQEAVAEGMAQVDKQLAARKRRGQAQVALIAVDPRTGEILALVGGRAYSPSQYNRAILARRQPGSVFKPFVYLAAFETMAEEGRADLTPRPSSSTSRRSSRTARRTTRRQLPGRVRRPDHACAARSRSRATSSPSRSPKPSATIASRQLWKRTGVGATAPRVPVDRAWASSKSRRSKWPRRTRCSRTAAPSGPLQAALADRRWTASRERFETGATRIGRTPRCHLPRHEHDAERAQRGNRRRARGLRASPSTRRARPARRTTCATRGSSGSRPSCSPSSGSASTTTSRSA